MRRTSLIPVFLFMAIPGLAQQPAPKPPTKAGEIDNKEITVEKSRSIQLQPASRLVSPMPAPVAPTTSRALTYQFEDRNLTIGDPKGQPAVLPTNATQAELPPVFHNYVKLGGGNYNSFFGEGFASLNTKSNYAVEVSARHLSSGIGPVDGANSARNDTKISVAGKYLTETTKLTGDLGYDRSAYSFYGYGGRPAGPGRAAQGWAGAEVSRDSIRQRLNRVSFGLGLENLDADQAIDYSLKTKVTLLNDYYSASETDWATHLKTSIGIAETGQSARIVALLDADAFVTQRTDGFTDNRNLFRIAPTFKYTSPLLTVTAGVRVANETDRRPGINQTLAFPVLNIDLVPTGNIHVFAGVDGDIQRNTLRSLLTENQWLSARAVLANTIKTLDFYGGSQGEIGSGFRYEGRASYALYRNLATFNNSWPDTTRFFVLYDGGQSSVLTISGQLGYSLKDKFRSTLRVDAYRYGLARLVEAWGRPTLTANWTNAYMLNQKLFVTADVYFLRGIRNQNFVSGQTVTLDPITDVNLKIDYFLGRQLSAFVSLNNLLGRNYERYLYYQQQGLNFLGGISYAF
jgi:hypothetical protein